MFKAEKQKVLKVKASLISKLAGYNRHCNRDEALDELITANPWLEQHLKTGRQCKNFKTYTEKELANLGEGELEEIALCLGLDPKFLSRQQIIAKLTTELTPCVELDSEERSRDKLRQFLDDHSPVRRKLSTCLEHDVRVKRGCYTETSCLDQFEKSTAIPVIKRNTTLYKKRLLDYKTFRVEVVGKVDGISQDETTLIETKQRRNGFFSCIPIYERVQLETYLWLTGLKQAIHIQNYNQEQKPVLYQPNPNFWKKIVKRLEDLVEELNLS